MRIRKKQEQLEQQKDSEHKMKLKEVAAVNYKQFKSEHQTLLAKLHDNQTNHP